VYINPGSNGTATLNNVTVHGTIYVQSGANNSIELVSTTGTTLSVDSSSAVHIVASGTSSFSSTIITSGEGQAVSFEQTGSGTFGPITNNSTSTSLTLEGTNPFSSITSAGGTLTISAPVTNLVIAGPVSITIGSGVTVTGITINSGATGVTITNNGTVSTLTNNASSSGVTLGGSGNVTTTSGPAPITTATKDASLAKLTTDLQTLHSQLSSAGITAIDAAGAHASSVNWASQLASLGVTSANQAKVAPVISDLIGFATYGQLVGDTSTTSGKVSQILTDFQTLDPNITGTDLYNFFENFKTSMLSAAIQSNINPSTSGVSIVTTALTSALNNTQDSTGTSFVSVLQTNYGVSASDVGNIYKNVQSQIDPNSAARNALSEAIGSLYFQFVAVPSGSSTYELQFKSSAPDGLGTYGLNLTPSATWTSTGATVTVNGSGSTETVTPSGTGSVTASIHGYTVFTTTQTW
jgi:hypothetical protein